MVISKTAVVKFWAWMSNDIPYETMDVITYPYPNFS